MLLLWILVLVIGVAWLAHRRTAPLPALGIVAVYLLAMGIASHAPGWLMLVLWLVLAAIATPLLLPDLRRKYFSAPMLSTRARCGGMANCSAAGRTGTCC
jgi:acyl-CoA dehydrogenase